MKNLENKHIYDCPKVDSFMLSTESTILDTSGDQGEMTPKLFFEDSDQV